MSCSSSTSMGHSLEAAGAAGFSLSALPRAGIGSTDLVPPGGPASGGAPALATPFGTVRLALWLPRPRRPSSTVRTAGAPSASAPPSPPAGCVRLASGWDVRIFSSFSKRSTRLAGQRSLMWVFLHRIPSVAGQGSRVVCTHSNSSGGEAYRWAILMLCHLPHHRRCLHGSPSQRPNSVRTATMRKTNVFGHIRAWAPFSPNSQNAENECFWAHSGLGPIRSEQPECGKRMFLGTFGLGPNSVRTAKMRKPNVFGHIRACAQFSPNSRNAENECFWAHSGLGPIESEQAECGKRMLLGTFGLGSHSVRTARMRKTNVFGHIRAWAQFSPNSQNAETEGFWHVRAWAPFSPNSQNAEKECFSAHSGLGPIQSEQSECGKRMFLGTFGLGPNSVRTARMRKTNVFGHIRAWAPFSPNSLNAENECFCAHSGLGPIQSEQPECGKRMFLGTFGLGPNSVRAAKMRKPNVFGHIRAWAQFSPNREIPISTKRGFPISTKPEFSISTKRESPTSTKQEFLISTKPGVPILWKLGIREFPFCGNGEFPFCESGIPDFHKRGIPDFHKTGIADFHKTGIPDSQNGNSPFPQNGNSRIPNFHKIGIPGFHKTGIPDFHKMGVPDSHQNGNSRFSQNRVSRFPQNGNSRFPENGRFPEGS